MEKSFSMLNLFTGDVMTLAVSIVLVVFSVLSWAVIIEKFRLWHMNKKNPVKIKQMIICRLLLTDWCGRLIKICGSWQWWHIFRLLLGCSELCGGLWIRLRQSGLISRSVLALLPPGWQLRWGRLRWG